MARKAVYVVGLVAAFLLGTQTNRIVGKESGDTQASPDMRAAYVVASVEVLEPDQLQAYYQAAAPLAKEAGFQMVASGVSDSTVHLLEGSWPNSGLLAIERFDSIDALLDFWNSEGYRAAKKLREGAMKVDFIVAIEEAK